MALTALFPILPLCADIRINEFVSEHQDPTIWPNAPKDMDGDYPDWIEIANTGASAVSLQGWRLSDDETLPAKWTFPAVSIPGNGYLLVYASNKNRAIAGIQLHTNFKIGSTGALILSNPSGTIISRVGSTASPYPKQRILASYGCLTSGANPTYGYMTTMSPAASNNTASVVPDFCSVPVFSVERGLYNAGFTTQISSTVLGGTIVYTLNGSEPTLTNGTVVAPANSTAFPTVNLSVSDSTIVRARVYKTGLGPSDIVTQSYIFWSRVVNQTGPLPTMGSLTTVPWGYTGINIATTPGEDWAVDPTITGSSDANVQFTFEHLKAVPTVSLVVPWKGMFGPSTTTTSKDGGMYIGAEANVPNEGVDRAASLEYFNPNGSTADPNTAKGFMANGLVHVFGGSSPSRWKQYKLSMNFKPADDVKYNVYGSGTSTKQHNFVLDAQSNQTWVHPDATQQLWADYMRDQVMSDLQNKMGGAQSFHGRPVHLFVNGMYWGMYNLHEQPSEQFDENYMGGDADTWDAYKHDISTLVSASYVDPTKAISSANSTTRVNLEALLDLVGDGFSAPNPTPDLTVRANYEAVWTKLDQPDFLNYMILNYLSGNSDWSHHNYFACFNRADPNGKWHFQSWDAEHTFKNTTDTSVNYDTDTSHNQASPEEIHHYLMVNAEYRLTFADAVQRLMFNNGILSVAGVQAVFTDRLGQADAAIRGESARWGDARKTPAYTRNTWLTERNRILNTVVPARFTKILSDFQKYNMYPLNTGASAVATPEFRDNATNLIQQGGNVAATFKLKLNNVTLNGAGTVYYTTDGSDPRTAYTGAPGATAQVYSAPILLGSPKRVKSRVLNGTTWSAVNDAFFVVDAQPAAAGNLVISKIQYHPANPSSAETAAGFLSDSDFEFIELMNIGSQTVDLLGLDFAAGIEFTFTDTLPIRFVAPGGRVLIVQNQAAFEFRYGTGLPIIGTFLGGTGLSNSGEKISIANAAGDIVTEATFLDNGLWSKKADGSGPALVLIRPKTNPDLNSPANWRPSTTSGSPGGDDRILYATWRSSTFSTADAANDAISGPTADPDGDGLSNVLEYARGTNPLSLDLVSYPALTMESMNVGAGLRSYGVLRVRYRLAAEDAVLIPQSSANLTTWASTDVPALSLTENSDGSATRAFRSEQPVDQQASRFFRLRAVYQP